MERIPDDYLGLFDRRTFAHVATVEEDGTPHVTPVWIDFDRERHRILINTERHRRKAKNVSRNPRVGISMLDPDNPYRRLSVIGTVTEVTTTGAREHIDELSQRYFDKPFPSEITSERVILVIRPDEVF